MMHSFAFSIVLLDRVLPTSGAQQPQEGVSAFTLVFIVGLALLITVLARYFSTRGNKKK